MTLQEPIVPFHPMVSPENQIIIPTQWGFVYAAMASLGSHLKALAILFKPWVFGIRVGKRIDPRSLGDLVFYYENGRSAIDCATSAISNEKHRSMSMLPIFGMGCNSWLMLLLKWFKLVRASDGTCYCHHKVLGSKETQLWKTKPQHELGMPKCLVNSPEFKVFIKSLLFRQGFTTMKVKTLKTAASAHGNQILCLVKHQVHMSSIFAQTTP